MKKLLLAAAMALALSGCANVQNAWNTLTGATVSPKAVYVAVNAADSAEIIAAHYLRVCAASPNLGAACAKNIEQQVADAARSVRIARNDLRAFMKAHPDALGAQGLYDALTQATSTLSDIENTYNIGAAK